MRKVVVQRRSYDVGQALERAERCPEYHEEQLLVSVAQQISDAMHACGMSRTDLARRLNVSPPYITKLLRGHQNLSLHTLARVARAFDRTWKIVLAGRGLRVGADARLEQKDIHVLDSDKEIR